MTLSDDGDALVAHDRLEEILVHAERRGSHARAHVGHARELEESLDGAVLAERAVQHGEDDIDVAERCGGPLSGTGSFSGSPLPGEPAPLVKSSSQRPSRAISIDRTS